MSAVGTVKISKEHMPPPAPGLDYAAAAMPVTSAQTTNARARDLR
jgi:hypothetical protein